jgi:hypothetical protein
MIIIGGFKDGFIIFSTTHQPHNHFICSIAEIDPCMIDPRL